MCWGEFSWAQWLWYWLFNQVALIQILSEPYISAMHLFISFCVTNFICEMANTNSEMCRWQEKLPETTSENFSEKGKHMVDREKTLVTSSNFFFHNFFPKPSIWGLQKLFFIWKRDKDTNCCWPLYLYNASLKIVISSDTDFHGIKTYTKITFNKSTSRIVEQEKGKGPLEGPLVSVEKRFMYSTFCLDSLNKKAFENIAGKGEKRLLKTLQEKEKMLETSIFSFSHYVFYSA